VPEILIVYGMEKE